MFPPALDYVVEFVGNGNSQVFLGVMGLIGNAFYTEKEGVVVEVEKDEVMTKKSKCKLMCKCVCVF